MRICGVGCRWGPSVPVGTTSTKQARVRGDSCAGVSGAAVMVHRATAGTTVDGCTAPQPTARPEGLGVRSSIQNPIRTGEATAQYAYVMAVTYQIRALATHAARRNTYPRHAYPTLYNRSPVLAFRFCGVPDPGR